APELPAPPSPQSAAQSASIDALLTRQLSRFRLPSHARPGPVQLTAATADLAVLRTFAQEPTGSRLLAGTDGGMVELDLDTSRAIPLTLNGIEVSPPPLFEPARVLRGGSVAFVVAYYGAPSVAYARSLAPSGDVVRLGPADGLVATGPEDAVWLWKGSALTEVRVTDGAVLSGPTTLPAAATVIGSVAGSLLLQTADSQIVRFDPHSSAQTRLGSATFAFGAPDGSLMWVTPAGPVHLARPDGRQLTTALPDTLGAALGAGAWSPDGRSLAAFFRQPDGSWQLRLIDLTSGVASAVAGATSDREPSSVVWSADGRRVFWLDGHARQGLATYRLGAPRAEVLRIGTLNIESIVLLP
nr:hypothetical protein [Actinomycetota bacterium]